MVAQQVRVTGRMNSEDKLARFEQSILPHMDAAYNLARWLSRNDFDAQDVVQEAYLRAFKFFAGLRSEDGRSWLLRIVRNTFYSWLEKNRRDEEKMTDEDAAEAVVSDTAAPDALLLKQMDSEALREAIQELPVEFREALVMRELEGLSYKEMADIANLPLGTVMSRLARARRQLRHVLTKRMAGKESDDLPRG